MTIDPSKSTTPYASITDVSYFKDAEDEVLFSMHMVFRIRDIKVMDENPCLQQVDLTLTNENDKDLSVLTVHIREETYPKEKGWYRLTSFLFKISQLDKAQQLFEALLEQTIDESIKGSIYNELGLVKHGQRKYEEAITFFEKAEKVYEKIYPTNHSKWATFYSNIGNVYADMDAYLEAISCYGKAITAREIDPPSNHREITVLQHNFARLCLHMGKYSEALEALEKALELRQNILPPYHADLAGSYNDIGNVYYNMDKYFEVLSFYEHAVDQRHHSLKSDSPSLVQSKKNLENVKTKL